MASLCEHTKLCVVFPSFVNYGGNSAQVYDIHSYYMEAGTKQMKDF
jgi:hypothetical protein